MTPYENEIKLERGDIIVVDHPRHGQVAITVQTAVNWTYSQTPTAASDWYVEGRNLDGAVYWKQQQDGGHIIKHNGTKVLQGD